jgi:hypothetical protein
MIVGYSTRQSREVAFALVLFMIGVIKYIRYEGEHENAT